MTQKPELQIGDVIEWGGEERTVERIEDGYAVWYGWGQMAGKKVALVHATEYGDSVRVVQRATDRNFKIDG